MNSVILPLTTLNCDGVTDAVTLPDDICVSDKPATSDARIYDAVTALLAQLDVPNNEPVNELADIFCVTVNYPVNPYEPVNCFFPINAEWF